jgi:hypothetical protein
MAFDLSDGFDIDMMDTIIVTSRALPVGGTDAHGRSTTTDTPTTIKAVVTMAGPNDLDRMPDADVFNRVISVVSRYKIKGEVTGYKPDLITWRGDQYLVKTLDPYPQFGSGWVQALCGSIDLVDAAT